MDEPIVIGVDAGGSKTDAVVASPSAVLGYGRGGSGNHQGEAGFERAMAEIRGALDRALAAAGLGAEDVAGAVLGVAGADFPEDYAHITESLGDWFASAAFRVVNDADVALAGGSESGFGVVVVCGTATNVVGLARDGKRLTVGGLGYEFGDLGGAADIIPAVLHHAFRSYEGRGPKTALESAVLACLGVDGFEALSRALYFRTLALETFHGLVPVAFEVAREGDRVAQDLLLNIGRAMGESAAAAVRRLGLSGEPVEVVMAGSVWDGPAPALQDGFREAVHREAPHAVFVRPRLPPVAGAVRMALSDRGVPGTSWPDLAERLTGLGD